MILAIDLGVCTGITYGTSIEDVKVDCIKYKDIPKKFPLFLDIKEIIFEHPEIYKNKYDTDPNQLFIHMYILGYIVGRYNKTMKVNGIHPKIWKGQIPKTIHNQRLLDLYPILNQKIDHVPKTLKNHCIDSFGLWVWYSQNKQNRNIITL